jgi:hypothetical protein
MKTIYQILLTMFCLLLGSQAFAQVELRLQPVRKDFIVGENVALKLTIVNQTDASFTLKNEPGRTWLNFTLNKRGDSSLIPPQAAGRFPEITLTPGSTRSFEFNLKSLYRLTTDGHYTVNATIRMPDGVSTYSSNTARFTMTNGGKLRDFHIQARGERITLSLRLASINGKDCLFGQAINKETHQVLGASFLAEYINFTQPRVLLDKAQNLHVLCQSSADFFTYSVMDTHGKRSSAKLYKRSGAMVDLISTGSGIMPVGLTPYEAPKPGSENVRKASERPF